jgi:hypothetical protein
MKKSKFFSVAGLIILLLVSSPALAQNQCTTKSSVSDDTPAILASLDSAYAANLNDSDIAAVRGQGDAKYVLVKLWGINMYDGGVGVQWTSSPQGYRYGYWGGEEWGNGQENPSYINPLGAYADTMDLYFKTHDLVYLYNSGSAERSSADRVLLAGLASLANTVSKDWGSIYVSTPTGLTTPNVNVYGISLIGGKFFSGWKPMPYSEYSRRQAMAMLGAKMLINSVANFAKIQ